MNDINELLGSISTEDMEKLKSVASSLMSGKQSKEEKREEHSPASGFSEIFGDDTSKMLIKVAEQMNKDNDKTAFIKALRPLLSDERRAKADEAIRFMKLMDTLPLLKGLI